MNRIEIIQALINNRGYKRYLEVGVQAGHCFNAIQCEHKVGVDPDTGSAATHHMTSDDFFEHLKQTTGPQNFDICFSDGLHHADQSERDILNMLDHLNEGGIIVCHDMLPNSKRMQEIPLQEQNEWCGNVWESWVKLRMWRDDLTMVCIDTDWGTSLIHKGRQELLKIDGPIDYEGFVKYRDQWMNVISVADFKRTYLNEL